MCLCFFIAKEPGNPAPAELLAAPKSPCECLPAWQKLLAVVHLPAKQKGIIWDEADSLPSKMVLGTIFASLLLHLVCGFLLGVFLVIVWCLRRKKLFLNRWSLRRW